MPWLEKINLAVRSANRRRLERRHAHKGLTYADWVQLHDTLDADVLHSLHQRMAQLATRPLISVLMPVFNPSPDWLRQAIGSVEQQIYPDWELCIADDRSTDPAVRRVLEDAAARDPRIRVCWRTENGHISRASNSALEMARGEFAALLDHDDKLPAHALLLNAEAISHHPRARLLYSDEDVLRFDGQRQSPNFKPDWNPELMRAQNLVCHLGVYATGLLRQIGGFRPGYEGAQDYDLALRCIEHLEDDQIVHIPHVLYHWRQHPGSSAAGDEVKPYITEAGRRALYEHLQRSGLEADVTPCPGGGYRVVPALPDPAPSVSIIVWGVDDATRVQRSLERRLAGARLDTEVLSCTGVDLQVARRARGEFLCLVAGDIEIDSATCLTEMMALATVPGTGAVGAKLLHPDGSLAHGGFILGTGQGAARAHPRLGAGQHGYRSRAVLNQNLAAVRSACMVIRRSLFLAVDGFDTRFNSGLRDVDLCLRLRGLGLRTVWAAHALATQPRSALAERWPDEELELLREMWGTALDDDPAYNLNLDLDAADFRLAPQPRVNLKQSWLVRHSPPIEPNSTRTVVPPAPPARPMAATATGPGS